jgi:hypothetical protein
MTYLEADRESGYQKIWFELQSMAWNRPALRDRVVRVNAEWRAVLTEAFAGALREYGIEEPGMSVDAIVALVMTFNEGVMLESLSGVTAGHAELLHAADDYIASLAPPHGKGQS